MKEKEQRDLGYLKSLLHYFLMSWPVYLTIIVMAIVLWAFTLPYSTEKHGEVYNHWIEFLASLAPNMMAAFFILWLTDFISKEHLSRLFSEQQKGAETIREAFDWGLKLYPSHSNTIIPTRRKVLEDYLEPGDELRILSGNGVSWFAPTDSILELIVGDGIKTKVVLFSPELHFEKFFEECRQNYSSDVIDRLAKQLAREQNFSRYQTKGELLIQHHKTIKADLDALTHEKRKQIEVRYTGIIPLCEFFVIGEKRAHGAVPMHTKTHRNAFSIQTFRGLRSGSENVEEFIKEFEHFWKPENSISEDEYFTKYARVS